MGMMIFVAFQILRSLYFVWWRQSIHEIEMHRQTLRRYTYNILTINIITFAGAI